jgi:uncharacterized protein YqeY
MNLFDKIAGDLMEAMKAREKEKLEALRNIKKALIEARAAKSAGSELTDDESLKVIQKLAKQGHESAAIYKEQGRSDLYDQEIFQVGILESYLPAKLSTGEIESYIGTLIMKFGANTMKDMGKVMAVASKELAGKAEGREISEVVKRLLSQENPG